MITWIINHARLIIGLIGTGLITVFGFAWTFILMGYNTEAKLGHLQTQVVQQQTQITNMDRQQSELIGIMKSIKDDTGLLKKTLIEDALKRKVK